MYLEIPMNMIELRDMYINKIFLKYLVCVCPNLLFIHEFDYIEHNF